jgi:hypothetical protein
MLTFFIAGLLYLLRFERVDNLGAYSIPFGDRPSHPICFQQLGAIIAVMHLTRRFYVRNLLVLFSVLLVLEGCNRNEIHIGDSVMADVTTDASFADGSKLSGKLYLSNGRLRVDWGEFADVFDLTKRTGWRVMANPKVYRDLADKDLSTYAPQVTNGSVCPSAQVPSACKLAGKEKVNGRVTNKCDVWNPRGFHVYFWTDDTLLITVRCDIGETRYEVRNFRKATVSDALFELPAHYSRLP